MHMPAVGPSDDPNNVAIRGVGVVHRRSFAEGAQGFTHLMVAIDKLSKWIEVRPLANIKSEQAVAFFTDIIHLFKVPNSIITNNGTVGDRYPSGPLEE
jgi:hypothetical protein